MNLTERGFGRTAVDSCWSLSLDFETFQPIADVLLMMSIDLITLQSTIISTKKGDGSPVSNADREAQRLIVNWLQANERNIPVRGEEDDTNAPVVTAGGMYWSVDPIDGTRYYEAMKDEWCVSVALFVNGKPWVGIVIQPARGEVFLCIRDKGIRTKVYNGPWKTFRDKKPVHPMLVVPTSYSVLSDQLSAARAIRLTKHFKNTFSAPSVLAALEIVRGHAWGWASLAQPWKWDIAATSLLIEEIGGVTMSANGETLNWDCDRLPSVIFARSQADAAEITAVLGNE